MAKNDKWYHLDNAAKIFPAVSDARNTNVYRISCELTEHIRPELLQCALNDALLHFACFRMIMRRGLFWFYLEPTDLIPIVELENDRLCTRLFYKNIKELLFRVTYYRNRINLEVFHAVADGTGALEFMRQIVYNYIVLCHKDDLPNSLPFIDATAPPANRAEDGFDRHYSKNDKKKPLRQRAYQISGTMLPTNSVSLISARMSTEKLLALAKENGASITAYISTLVLFAIYHELMPRRQQHRDIGITVPVDLRRFFPSMTARNFFTVVDVRYNFSKNPADFNTVLASVKEQLAQKLVAEDLARTFSFNMSMQRNILSRTIPLALKNVILKAVYNRAEKCTSCAISNLGRVKMPLELQDYIERFSFFLNPTPIHRLKLCMGSFGEEFVINFTSCIEESGAQRYILRHLAAKGIDITITTNGGDDDEAL